MLRKLEKLVEITKDENVNEITENIRLEYYLLQTELTDGEQDQDRQAFGIEIIKKTVGGQDEVVAFKDIFGSMDSTRVLIDKLARNSVTPITFPYILDDMLGI